MKKLFWVCLPIILMLGCKGKSPVDPNMLSVSIIPQKYFVEQIAGKDFSVNVVIPPGASPADYDPTPGNMEAISKSGAYLRMGKIGFEITMLDKITALNPNLKMYDLSKNVIFSDAIKHDFCGHEGKDPHIWMSARNVKIIAQNIFNVVSTLKPDRASFYQDNLADFLRRIDSLDAAIEEKLNTLSTRAFVIFHPALTYYAQDYDLEQIPLEIEGKEPSAAWVQKVVKLIEEKQVKLLFIQGEFSQNSAKAVAENTHIDLEEINPLSPDWMKEYVHISDMIAEKMK